MESEYRRGDRRTDQDTGGKGLRLLSPGIFDPVIRIEGLTYTFAGRDRPALQSVDLEIESGEFVVVTGPSGCGKSTLALAIGGYLFQQYEGKAEGSVRVAGLDARHAPIHEVADIVGLVQQNPEAQFCTTTVRDEVAFGLENRCQPVAEIRQRVDWALDTVGASDLIDRELHTLSGGEKQKIAIASVLALQPQVLILDEPTSNLDPTATAAIFEVIADIRASVGITAIVIEHKLDFLRPFKPRLITLEKGRIRCVTSRDEDYAFPEPPARLGGDRSTRKAAVGAKQVSQDPVVEVEDLHVRLGDSEVLKGLSLRIHAGEFVVIMGDNGSGKTTLLRTLLGLQRPTVGEAWILGAPIGATPVSALARDVGFVFQNPDHQLFGSTVWEEATIAAHQFGLLDRATRARTKGLLDEAGLGTRLDDHPYRLSYGEKRRLNVISVLGHRPSLLLLDEILIGQDPANAGYLLALLKRAVDDGATVVMVSHDPEVTYRWASRLIFMEDGHIRIDGPVNAAARQLADAGYTAYVPHSWRDVDAAPMRICQREGA